MALKLEELRALNIATAKASLNPAAAYSFGGKNLEFDAMNAQLREEMNALARTNADYRDNKNVIFRLMEEGLSEVIPPRIIKQYGQFADVKTYAQGDKPVFKLRISDASRQRAKSFVTRAGLAGRYEVFKLDGYSMELNTSAFGAAAEIAYEEFLDGKVTMADVYDIVVEGMDEAVYREIAKALESLITEVKPINKVSATAFDEEKMGKLLGIADTYGKAAIYCTLEFALQMIPDVNWASDAMKDQVWTQGFFTNYKGHNVIVLPQSLEDITNTTKVIDPSKAFIIPAGAEKPVKVGFEGTAQVKEIESQDDWSRVIHTYQKVGVGLFMVNPGICVYENTSLTKDVATSGRF